jgi:hypothetical protein
MAAASTKWSRPSLLVTSVAHCDKLDFVVCYTDGDDGVLHIVLSTCFIPCGPAMGKYMTESKALASKE